MECFVSGRYEPYPAEEPTMIVEPGEIKHSLWLIPALVFLLLVTMFARTPLDTDMWWHLRAGEVSWISGSPLLTDIFSYTVYGTTWINHSWLAQVLLYLVYAGAALKGLTTLVALVAAATLILIYAEMAGPPLFRAFILILGGLVIAPVLSPRPQIFSLLMLAALSYVIFLNRYRGRNVYYLIPLIFILWSNLHGGYVLGLIFLGAWIIGEIFNIGLAATLPGIERRNEVIRARQHAGQLFTWTLIGGVVTIINPNGVRIWLVPFQTVGVAVLQDFIPEWASPNFHNLFEQPFIWLLIACFIAVSLAKLRLDGPELVTFGIFTYMALLSKRNFGPFAIIATPILAKYGWEAITAYREPLRGAGQSLLNFFHFRNIKARALPDWLRIGINCLLILVLGLIAIGKVLYVSSPAVVESSQSQIFPVEAVQWMAIHPVAREIFNDYNWGGYLIWHLRDIPVFIDGRTDLYKENILADYLTIQGGFENWHSLLEQYGVNSIFTATGSPLAEKLQSDPGWVQAYYDNRAVIFLRQLP
jgi:hypothetical protein